MALVVEDGTGLATAESYLSVADFRDKAAALGLWYLNTSDPTESWLDGLSDREVEAALRRATAHIDGEYGDRWLGTRGTVEQALDWPRVSLQGRTLGYDSLYVVGRAYRGHFAYPYVGDAIGGSSTLPSGELPPLLRAATLQVAVREAAKPGGLRPDSFAGDIISESVAGAISVTYANARTSVNTVPAVDVMLRPLLTVGGSASAVLRRS